MYQKHDPTQDDDLKSAFHYHISSPSFSEVESILAQIPGEADGADWNWIVGLKGNKYGLATGGCDYTGWYCQSSATIRIFDTPEEAAKSASDYRRHRLNVAGQLLKQLTGEQPYALYIEPEKNTPPHGLAT